MFDEVDEGTAMFKAASTLQDTPAEGQFLYLSVDGVAVPDDFYLSLAGNFTAQWRPQYQLAQLPFKSQSLPDTPSAVIDIADAQEQHGQEQTLSKVHGPHVAFEARQSPLAAPSLTQPRTHARNHARTHALLCIHACVHMYAAFPPRR